MGGRVFGFHVVRHVEVNRSFCRWILSRRSEGGAACSWALVRQGRAMMPVRSTGGQASRGAVESRSRCLVMVGFT